MRNFFDTFRERAGVNAFVAGNFDKAERYFRELERSEPDSISVLRNLGMVLLAKGDAEGAERYLLKEEKLYGKSFHRHSALGDLAYARARRKEALKRYKLALEESEAAEGGSAWAIRPLMERRISFCEDEKSFAPVIESMRKFAQAQEARVSGDDQRAIELYIESASLDETNWPALNNAGSIYLNSLGDPGEAAALFEKAFSISHNVQAARNLELARRKLAKGKKR